jgi:hypothetical protein
MRKKSEISRFRNELANFVITPSLMRVTPGHWYCHLNTPLHRHGTAQPAPFPIRLSCSFLQSVNLASDDSGSSHSSLCILVYTDSARFDRWLLAV